MSKIAYYRSTTEALQDNYWNFVEGVEGMNAVIYGLGKWIIMSGRVIKIENKKEKKSYSIESDLFLSILNANNELLLLI